MPPGMTGVLVRPPPTRTTVRRADTLRREEFVLPHSHLEKGFQELFRSSRHGFTDPYDHRGEHDEISSCCGRDCWCVCTCDVGARRGAGGSCGEIQSSPLRQIQDLQKRRQNLQTLLEVQQIATGERRVGLTDGEPNPDRFTAT